MDRVTSSRNQKADPNIKETSKKFKSEIGIKLPIYEILEKIIPQRYSYLGDYMVKKLVMLSEDQLIGRK